MSGSSAGYQSPPWAHPPRSSSDWKLLEIKAGVQVAVHELKAPCTVLGRAEDRVQIALAHESCSRLHARIAFDASGTAWLRDLGSTHGTAVNKRRLPPEACGSAESGSATAGSRGVVLYPGDVVQFGASTRLYCVEGPEENSLHRQKLLKDLSKSTAGSSMLSHSETPGVEERQPLVQESDGSQGKLGEDGVSWGIYDDDESDQLIDASATAQELERGLRDDLIPPQHRKAWDKIQALQYKVTNLEIESSRIRRKGEDLSHGQERQLQRNEERTAQLRKELDGRKLDLWRKIHPESGASRAIGNNTHEFVEEDEVDDRTGREEAITFDESGETEESLLQKHALLLERLNRTEASLAVADDKASSIQNRVSQLRAAGHEEDAFYAENDLNLANDIVQKLRSEKSLIDTSLRETNRLLTVINPKWLYNAETITSSKVDTEEQEVELMPSPPPRKPLSLTEQASENPMPPPPPRIAEPIFDEPPIDVPFLDSRPTKRARVTGPSVLSSEPSPEDVTSASSLDGSRTSLPRASSGMSATIAALAAASAQPSGSVSGLRHGKVSPALGTKAAASSVNNIDPTRDVWKPPEDQDGSGYTKLNAKFAGRY